MEQLKIKLTEEQFYQLRDFYRSSPNEQMGIMYASINKNEILINKINIFSDSLLERQSPKFVAISGDTFINAVIDAKMNGADVIISIHTHPNVGGKAYLSDTDKKGLKRDTKILQAPILNMLAIEGVITSKGMNFFVWDKETKDAIRIDCYINTKPEIDAEKKNIFQIFKESLQEGRQLAKRKIPKSN